MAHAATAAQPTAPVTVAIIGSAGRGADASKMTAQLFERMICKAHEIITADWKLQSATVSLLSGGAAWSDHVAVRLFMDGVLESALTETDVKLYRHLTVRLPCPIDQKSGRAHDSGSSDWRTNPGRSVNQYHRHFTRVLQRDTCQELRLAEALGATLTTHAGFHKRNDQVAADCDRMIAFSWGDGDAPTDGGTAYTWNKAAGKIRIHVPLASLK